ncbi:chalcone isomerase family protein [Acidisoma sp. 7E03]
MVLALAAACAPRPATAAELDGIQMPNQTYVDDTRLTLNGLALRTATMLNLHVYVVGLYLTQPNHDADAIIASPAPKLLRFVFKRDVDEDKVRGTWRKSLERNCQAPCSLPAAEVAQFLSRVPAMHAGDVVEVLFTQRGVDFTVNGRSLGEVTDPTLCRVILLGYIGPDASPRLVRDAILGLR